LVTELVITYQPVQVSMNPDYTHNPPKRAKKSAHLCSRLITALIIEPNAEGRSLFAPQILKAHRAAFRGGARNQTSSHRSNEAVPWANSAMLTTSLGVGSLSGISYEVFVTGEGIRVAMSLIRVAYEITR